MEEVIKRLHTQGRRMTAQRRLILTALQSIGNHPTAEELHELVKRDAPGLNLSTVYRTMRWLEQEGLVIGHVFEQDQRQERFDPSSQVEHFHFICTTCRRVSEFDNSLVEEIKKEFTSQSGSRVDTVSLVFYGECADCRSVIPVEVEELESS